MQKINQYWREGKYFDLWSLNHILSGVILGGLLFHFGVSFLTSLVVALVLFALWEGIEIFLGIKEHLLNIYADIILDFLGFFVAGFAYFFLVKPFSTTTFVVLISILAVLCFWGFIAYEKRQTTLE